MKRACRLGSVVLLLCSACRSGGLTLVTAELQVAIPADPAALAESDAGLVVIDFGQVTIGSTDSLLVDLAAVGGGLTLGTTSVIQADPELSLPLAAGTTIDNAPLAVSASFTPTSIGEKTALFRTPYTPGTSALSIELRGEGIASGLTISPDPLDFGHVEVNQVQALSVNIENDSTLPATLVLSAPRSDAGAAFTVGAPADAQLAPGASTTLSASFAPLVDGETDSSFTVTGWGGASPVTVNLTGIGTSTWLQVTPQLDFGNVQLTSSSVKSAVLTNLSGYATLHLVNPAPATSNAAFSLATGQAALPAAIPPGQSLAVPVTFAPPDFGQYSATLSLATDDPQAPFPVVDLEGYGGGPLISCQPVLSFGSVLAGETLAETAICQNVGTDVPGHPEQTLQFSQSDLSVEGAAYSASLVSAGASPVQLKAGQSAGIQVAFHPSDAGLYPGRLAVASNDLNQPDAGILLLGAGALPGDCSLQILPLQLDFGDILPGTTGRMQFSLTNAGQDFCLIETVRLEPGGDPSFSMPATIAGPTILSFGGNPANPGNLPTSVLLEVDYAPQAAEAAALGSVEVVSLKSTLDLPVTASSTTGCLAISPASFDFGSVAFSSSDNALCSPDSQAFVAINQCQTPLTINELTVAAGAYAQPQFSVSTSSALPLQLAGGDQFGFQAGLVPSLPGAKVGGVLIDSSDKPQTQYDVPLAGDPEPSALRTDTFTVPAPPKKLDLAWIIDNDDDADSMKDFAAVLPTVVSLLDQEGIDYQMAVTSTDTCDANGSDEGAFEPCATCLSQYDAGPAYITAESAPDPTTALGTLFDLFETPPLADCSIRIGDEHLFDALADTFSPGLLSGHNAGFIRPDAYLAIVLINGDGEDDGFGIAYYNVPASDYVTSLPDALTLVQALKPDPSQVSFSIFYEDLVAPGQVSVLARATGGVALPWEPDSFDALTTLFSYGGKPVTFLLTDPDLSTINVAINGVPTSDYAVTQGYELVLTPVPPPAPGSIVTVTYQSSCN